MNTRPQRETAYRVFAAEFDDTTLSYAESDEERAPNYVVTPTGARVNRLFVVGVLTEIESVNEEQLRARVVDPTGAFVVYAGQYQPEALSFLERTDPPEFVAVTGKARTFEPEDSDRVFTSIRPESLAAVDATTRDRWSVATAERTIERTETLRDALGRDERGDALREALEAEGVEASLAAGIPLAIEHYGTTPTYLDSVRRTALDAARVVADEREEVGSLNVAPDEGNMPDAGDAPDRHGADRDSTEPDASDSDTSVAAEEPDTDSASTVASESADESQDGPGADADTATTTDEERETQSETDKSATPETTADSEQTPGPDQPAESDRSTTGSETDTSGTAAGSATEDDTPAGSTDGTETSDDGIDSGTDEDAAADVELDDPEAFELDDDVREQVENEYGTDFKSAAEIDEPGEADIETPDVPDENDEETDTADAPESTETVDPTDSVENEVSGPTGTDETEGTDDEGDGDTEPEEAVVTAMRDLDDGDGADREAVVERVVEEYGLTPEEADDGIQDALMSGECYEPDDDTLKSI
jgi:hypothetical protein